VAVSVGACVFVARLVVHAPPIVVVLVLPVDCSLIFCCRCDMMPRSLVWAREHVYNSGL
jgi:hypothetical protein